MTALAHRAEGGEAPAGRGAMDEAPLELPRRLGRFLLFDHIGRGGMADIYLARLHDDLVDRRFVLKVVRPELSADPVFERLFVAEARLAAHLSHANVVQVFELGRVEERLYLLMEYVEGFDLNKLLAGLSRAKVPLPAEFAIHIVCEMLRGLDYAHRARDDEGRPLGLVHRDVSPSNVLVSFEGEVKLCDFGIARALAREEEASADSGDAEVELRRRTLVVGKASYMSPEQARGEPVDARSDVYGAGVILWELCAGRRMHRGDPERILEDVRQGRVPELPDRGLPGFASLRAIVERALAFDPKDRWGTAAEMLDALEEWRVVQRLHASPLGLGRFLTEHLGEEIVERRRARERAAAALEKGTPPVMTTVESKDEARPAASPATARPVRRGGIPTWIPLMVLGMVAVIALMLYAGLD